VKGPDDEDGHMVLIGADIDGERLSEIYKDLCFIKVTNFSENIYVEEGTRYD